MSQEQLNNVMPLHVHKQKTDELVLEEVARDFVNDSEHRLHIFGKFRTQQLLYLHVTVSSHTSRNILN